jgi:threonine/homoserine/homoserine lactone efflux protein
MRGKNDDGDSWKPFENGILTLVNPKQNIFFGSIIEIVSLGGSALEDSPISGLSQL